jgi:hypothetical protein
MAGIRHATTVVTPDDSNYEVGSNEWNDDHVIDGNVDYSSHYILFKDGIGGLACSELAGDGSLNKVVVLMTSTSAGVNNSYLGIRSIHAANHQPVTLSAENDQDHHTPIAFKPLNDEVRCLFTQDTPGAGGEFPEMSLWNTLPSTSTGNITYGSAQYSCYLQNAPVAGQFAGGLACYTRTEGGFKTEYGSIRVHVVHADSSEESLRVGETRFRSKVLGTNETVFRISAGMLIGGTTASTYPGLGNLGFASSKGIYDDGGNETLVFDRSTTPANFVRLKNADASAKPTFTADGSDTNVGIGFNVKGDPNSGQQSYTFNMGAAESPTAAFIGTGAGSLGPVFNFIHDSSSPAAGDYPAAIEFQGYSDPTHVKRTFGAIYCKMVDPTNAAEDGLLEFYSMVNGATTREMMIGEGVTFGSTNMPGAGSISIKNNIELGHSSDCTLGRTTTNILALEGVPVVSGGITVDATTSHTLAMTDAAKVLEMTNAGASVVVIPPSSSVAFPDGSFVNITRKGAGAVSVTTGAGVTLLSKSSGRILSGQYSMATVYKSSDNSWILGGDVSTV